MQTPIALITGANKGIGYATADSLGRRGHLVLLGCRDRQRALGAEKSLRQAGIDAHALTLDVTDQLSADTAATWIDDRFGRLDVLINNAGVGGSGDTVPAALRAALETNVIGTVAVTEAMLGLLRRSDAGRIVNVSSAVGSIAETLDSSGPLWRLPASVPYPTSKAALNMVTACYAKQLWDSGGKVNAANPGYCATDLNGHTGFRTAEQGAETVVELATLDNSGPTGVLWGHRATTGDNGVLPW